MCLAGDVQNRRNTFDFADMFGAEELTIKRDLQELRSYGIAIHSEKKRGVCLCDPISVQKLRSIILQYIGICYSENSFDKSTALMVRKLKEKALANIVTLQRCIDLSMIAVVDYGKEADEIERGREIWPLMIFSSEGYWRVLAVNDGKIKQYHLNKLIEVKPTTRKFKRIPQEQIDDMFRYSFKSWIGTEKHHVKIWLSKLWACRIKPRQMMEAEVITENSDGSVIFEATVNSLDEVASWAVSRGEGVVVLEPEELREKVVEIARGALANYS